MSCIDEASFIFESRRRLTPDSTSKHPSTNMRFAIMDEDKTYEFILSTTISHAVQDILGVQPGESGVEWVEETSLQSATISELKCLENREWYGPHCRNLGTTYRYWLVKSEGNMFHQASSGNVPSTVHFEPQRWGGMNLT